MLYIKFQKWTDSRLSWDNIETLKNVTEIYVPQTEIWEPDLFVMEAYVSLKLT